MRGLRPVWALAACAAVGCHAAPPACDRAGVSARVAERFGQSVGPSLPTDEILAPPGLETGRPLGEDQAVLLALWNNPAFQELLVELQLTRADLIQADLLPNPEVIYTFAVPDKAYRYAVEFPIEAVWLRPVRVKAAAAENARACERLTQAALDLIRDTRQAHADLVLARDRVRVADEALALRTRIADVAEARLRAGDATPQEAATARIDALQARQDAARVAFEVPLAGDRLKNLTGLFGFAVPLVPDDGDDRLLPDLDTEALVREAVGSRPDAVAADHAERAAAERVRFARLGWVRFLGILDATAGQRTGHEFGPGLRVTLPVFNRNQGMTARAEAEREQAARRRLTVHNQIVLDVRLAHARYRQAAAELALLREKVRPEVEAAVRRTERAYQAGNAPYLLVLEATRQVIDAAGRDAQLRADVRRAKAELERSVGRRLDVYSEPLSGGVSPPLGRSPTP